MASDPWEVLDTDGGWLGWLARDARAVAASYAGSVEQGELFDEREAGEDEPLQLAAAELDRAFPVHYSGGGLRLVLGRGHLGAWCVLTGGAARWEGQELVPGVEISLAIEAPPAWLQLDVDGRPVFLLPDE